MAIADRWNQHRLRAGDGSLGRWDNDLHDLTKACRQKISGWRSIMGLSGILCGGPVSSVEEPLAKDDGELCLCLDPFPRRPFPLLGRVVKNEI